MTKTASVPSKLDFPVPAHVAIIMDGNGRWARSKSLFRIDGHKAGAKSVRTIVEESRRLGIRYLTLYTFSTENWLRPEQEVSALMKLLFAYLQTEIKTLLENNIRLRAIGDLSKLPKFVGELLQGVIDKTASCDGMDLILALSYGGRDEIVAAAKKIAEEVSKGKIELESIQPALFQKYLYAPDIPDPDVLIRTSDECRVSNFLLWQIAYSEIVVSPVAWPDFGVEAFHDCLKQYSKRVRRFGMTDEQLSGTNAKADLSNANLSGELSN